MYDGRLALLARFRRVIICPTFRPDTSSRPFLLAAAPPAPVANAVRPSQPENVEGHGARQKHPWSSGIPAGLSSQGEGEKSTGVEQDLAWCSLSSLRSSPSTPDRTRLRRDEWDIACWTAPLPNVWRAAQGALCAPIVTLIRGEATTLG